ncbi:hypothetical protein IGI04_016067 [Brassica rapa subsp. trilocularis]|uniref:Uncharacterized protein n=1 Tax=Brassica rapa subsp. trilocularis TaxID=1813537 RepID=A0ABQ7MRV7_BRACM|nr:hypothetical protein IGI04_016062 [Brassica rapa subsp. trilocularis]KAG5401460.1 hypothetical protein IGI04_016067 [Brassica rapa subsp. trilocularis]
MESLSRPLLLLFREEAYLASGKGNSFILNRRDLSSGSLITPWKKKLELPDPPEFIHLNFELKSMEKEEMVEQESIMKGPGSFPGETLLAIFQCIASVGDSSFGEKEDEEGQEEATGYDKEMLGSGRFYVSDGWRSELAKVSCFEIDILTRSLISRLEEVDPSKLRHEEKLA